MDFLQYELKPSKNNPGEYEFHVYVDDLLTEFSTELGEIPKKKGELLKSAWEFIKHKYPKLKVTVVKVIAGGIAITALPLGIFDKKEAAAAEYETAQVQTEGNIHYKVSSGDTLWKLSQKFNTNVQAIKQANDLQSDSLKVGQRLIIPKAMHTVVQGDYLSVLAKKYGVSIDAIKQANNKAVDSTQLGETLIIPYEFESSSITDKVEAPNDSDPKPTGSSYTVVSGDTLSGIAKKFGTTVSALKSANQLTSDMIHVGQTLTVPGEGAENTPIPSPTPEPTEATSTYTVKSGDSLSKIAKDYGMSVQ